MARMKVAQVSKAKGDFEIVEREIPSPGPGQVRIKVQACGVCHSDLYTKDGLWPGLPYPRIPGHEIAGVIDEVGSGVSTRKKGDRAGVGWHDGQDNTCPACGASDFVNCESGQVTGISFALSGVRPMIEKFPLQKAAEAYARMLSGQAKFRVVLTM
jgi:D-arabinose 1-dehydrogenase-like Zn-dependent alcohol dehydrogenase